MSQAGFTPIQLYHTTTASAAPTAGNLSDGELAINTTDEKLYFKNSAGTVKLLAANITPVANGGTGATTASSARTNLGATTLGANLFTVANPSAVTFPRFNADNTISALDAASFRTAIGAGTGGGSVTSVGGTGTVNGISLSGTVTASGSLTLGGTLSGVSLTTQVTGTLPVANGGTGATTLTANNVLLGNGTSALQAVAPGALGNVLTSNGTTWVSQAGFSGAVTLLSTTTVSSPVAFVDITESPSIYVGLIINVTRMLGSVSLSEVQFNFLNTSSSPFVEFLKSARITTGSGTVTSGATSSGTPIGLGPLIVIGGGASFAVNLQLNLQFNNPTTSPFTAAQCTYMASSVGDSKAFSGIVGSDSNATQAGGIRLSFSSGNIVGGTIKVYGIRA